MVPSYWDIGGGIVYGNLYCAFSGFPEKLDEAFSLIYAMYVTHNPKWPSNEFSAWVYREMNQHYSDNEFIEPVLIEFLEFYKSQRS